MFCCSDRRHLTDPRCEFLLLESCVDGEDLITLVSDLFAVISSLSTYPQPYHLPPVQLKPVAQLQQMVCSGPCQLRGFYIPRKGVFLSDALDVNHDVVARSVLLHELVHHVQATSGHYEGQPDSCERATREERQAYDIQNRYLASVNDWRRFPMPPAVGGCDELSQPTSERSSIRIAPPRE
jgi:hypothetical protein